MSNNDVKKRRISAKSYMQSPSASTRTKPTKKTTSAKKASPKKASPKKTTILKMKISSEELLSKIQEKAYEFFELRGYSHGYDSLDWSIAEYIVKMENGLIAPKKKSRKKIDADTLNAMIVQKAQEICEQRGYGEGQQNADWIIAERIVILENKL